MSPISFIFRWLSSEELNEERIETTELFMDYIPFTK